METKAVDFSDRSLLAIRRDILLQEMAEVEYQLSSMYREWRQLLKQLETYETGTV